MKHLQLMMTGGIQLFLAHHKYPPQIHPRHPKYLYAYCHDAKQIHSVFCLKMTRREMDHLKRVSL